MASEPYASLDDLKRVLGKEDDADDDVLARALLMASRFIDEQTGRRFDKITETRTIPANGSRRIDADDFVSVSAVTYAYYTGINPTPQTVAVPLFFPGPTNPAVGWPYQWLDLPLSWAYPWSDTWSEYGGQPAAWQSFIGVGRYPPSGRHVFNVTGVWGWPAVPEDIQAVCISIAARWWKAAKAGFSDTIGVDALGTPQFSKAISTLDRQILEQYETMLIV